MSFHPEKCSILSISRSTSPSLYRYKLKGHELERTKSSKYLGVTISSDLSWGDHIHNISKKANSVLGFLRRNLKTNNIEVKERAYNSLVRPHLEYCCSVWNPWVGGQIKQLEMVQRRAARYVLNRHHNTSSVTSMLDQLGWVPLETRRRNCQLSLFYKIVNNHVDISASDYLTPAYSRTRAQHGKKFLHFSSKCDNFRYSFFPRTVPTWNNLPAGVAEAPSLVSFKQGLYKIST